MAIASLFIKNEYMAQANLLPSNSPNIGFSLFSDEGGISNLASSLLGGSSNEVNKYYVLLNSHSTTKKVIEKFDLINIYRVEESKYPFIEARNILNENTSFEAKEEGKAIEKSDISKVMPMLSFTPLFLLVTSPVILGETIHLLGILGILFVVIGSYLLNLDLSKNSIFEPFKGLLREKGTRYMLIVSFLWSFSANFDKLSIQNSSILQHIIFVDHHLIFPMQNLYLFRPVLLRYPFRHNHYVSFLKLLASQVF